MLHHTHTCFTGTRVQILTQKAALLVIRIFPMTPNFFINLAAPLIRLPVVPHVAAATIGLAPITFLTVQAGMTLSSLNSLTDVC